MCKSRIDWRIVGTFLAMFGFAVGAPAQTLTPTALSFASTVIGTPSARQSVSLTNGATALSINRIAISGDFSETTTCPLAPKTLAANATCKVRVTFTPTALGARTGTLTITDSAGNSPQTASLNGAGVAPVTLAPTSLLFGKQFLATTSAAKKVTVTNYQTVPLTISSIATSGAFAAASTTCPLSPNTLAAKSTCTISVTFTPAVLGSVGGTLTVTDDASNSPQTAQLNGTGVGITFSPSSLSFPAQILTTTSSALTTMLTNSQTVALTITNISTSGDFAKTSTTCPLAPSTLAGGGSCTISVTFTPTTLGTRNGTLTVTDNAPIPTQTASLTGAGTLSGMTWIGITPTAPTIPAGTELQLAATGEFPAAVTVNITNYVTWSSSAKTIASMSSSGLAQALAAGTSTITASYGNVAGSETFTVAPPLLSSIAVTPSNLSLAPGGNQQYTAMLNYGDGSSKDGTDVVSWSSSAGTVATVSSSGLATTLASGSTNITATFQSMRGSARLTVPAQQCTMPPPGLAGWWTGDGDNVDIAGNNSGVLQNGASFAPGEVGNAFSFGGNAASVLVNAPVYSPAAGTLMFWFLSNGGGVITGSIAASAYRAPGFSFDSSGNLLWEFGNLLAQSLGQVSSNQWHHVALTYATSGTEVTVNVYLDGNLVANAIAIPNQTWNSQVAFGTYLGASLSSFVGEMDEIAIFNQALTLSQVQQVYAAFSGGMCKPTLQSIALNPAIPALLAPGTGLQFSALGTYSDSASHDLTSSASWNSSNPLAATISATGLATGVAPGSTTIGAALKGQNGSATLNVGPSLVAIQLAPAAPTIAFGTTQAFTATGKYSDGSSQNVTGSVTWSSNSPAATIAPNGVASGITPGQATITAAFGAVNSSTTLTVSSAVLTSISVTPANPSLLLNGTVQFSAIGTFSDSSQQDVSNLAAWSSSNPGAAGINTTGLATALSLGSTTVTASFNSINGSTTLSVVPPPPVLQSITVSPSSTILAVGFNQPFSAQGSYSDGSMVNITSSVQWSSSAPGITSISNSAGTNGLATGVSTGSTTITASLQSISGTANLTITSAVLSSIAIAPASPTNLVGGTTQFTATGIFSDGSSFNITNLVTWSSSASVVANISNAAGTQGLASNLGPGISRISAGAGSVEGSTTLTVQDQLLSLAVTPTNTTIPPGTNQQYTATGTYLSGLVVDITDSVQWSSASSAIATISGTGLAMSQGTGQTTVTATAGALSSSATLAITPIQHVVIIFQENRTTDNLFQGLPNADIATSGVNHLGQVIPLQPFPLASMWDLSHGHHAFMQTYNHGKMNGADLPPVTCVVCPPPPNPMYGYANPSDVAPYLSIAKQYTFADRMFQTNQGPSFPAHQFIISGTSAPTATSDLFSSEQPYPPHVAPGCLGPPTETVQMIDPSGSEYLLMYPCFEHPVLADLLDNAGLSWHYYTPSVDTTWSGPSAIQHMVTGPQWKNVVVPQTQVLTDIAAGQLPAVSWVIPSGQASDHSDVSDGSGPSWVSSVVNAIGQSPYWSNTAILISWDDWGGWYDHVAPPILNSYEYGFRVPLIVVSPYAKPAYVTHVTHDFGSFLKMIEQTFNLPSLGYADSFATDLSDCFNFNQTPLVFQPINAPLGADYFLNNKEPPTDPDDD